MRARLLLVLTFFPTGVTRAGPLPKREPPEPGLELRLETPTPKMKRGQDVRWEVTIVNRGKQEVTLVQPGDGSDCGWRTPIIEWVINGGVEGATRQLTVEKTKVRANDGAPAPKPTPQPACLGERFGRIARCGNINSLKADEVFVLKPGQQVRLNAWMRDGGSQRAAGTYKVAVRYFHIPDLQWKGVPLGEHDPRAMDRIRRSAPVTLESNVVEIVVED